MGRAEFSDQTKTRVKTLALLVALIVTIIWSSSFVIVKFALESLGPLTIAGLRYTLGALALFPFCSSGRVRKNTFPATSGCG